MDSSKDLAEKSGVGSLGVKRKRSIDEVAREACEQRQAGVDDRSSLPLREMAPLVPRNVPYGGSDPPYKKFLLATTKHLNFHHDKDVLLVNDLKSCAELARLIRGGTCMMPEISELAVPDKFSESAHADIVVSL